MHTVANAIFNNAPQNQASSKSLQELSNPIKKLCNWGKKISRKMVSCARATHA